MEFDNEKPFKESYNLPLKKTYKKDASTEIVEAYQKTQDNRSIESININENGALKSKTVFSYDDFGRKIKENNYIDESQSIETNFIYTTGNYLQKIETAGVSEGFSYDEMGRVVKKTDPNGNVTNIEYDGFGRITKITNPDGTSNTNEYHATNGANYLVNTNENQVKTVYNYDIMGVLKGVTDLETNEVDLGYLSGKPLYGADHDKQNRIESEIDAHGVKTKYEYDYLNRITKKYIPYGYTETYIYEDAVTPNMSKMTKTIVGDKKLLQKLLGHLF